MQERRSKRARKSDDVYYIGVARAVGRRRRERRCTLSILYCGDRGGRGETARGKMSAYFSLSSSDGRVFADTFFPPSPSSTYKQPAEALKRVFPLPLYVVVQNASAIEQNAHFKMRIAGGKKPCLHFANGPSPAACFDVVRHCKRCKSGRPGCYYPCNPPASHAAARRSALSSRMLRARRSKGAAARSPSDAR